LFRLSSFQGTNLIIERLLRLSKLNIEVSASLYSSGAAADLSATLQVTWTP